MIGTGASVNAIDNEIISFENLRLNLMKRLKLKNWFVLRSNNNLQIFNLNKKWNGNLSIRNTICIDITLVVKVFGENGDDVLFSWKLCRWPQLQTLIDQLSSNENVVVDVKAEARKFETLHVEDKKDYGVDQQEDVIAAVKFEFCATNTETYDLHRPLTELNECSVSQTEPDCSPESQACSIDFPLSELNECSVSQTEPNKSLEYQQQQIDESSTNADKHESPTCSICNKSVTEQMDHHMQRHFNGQSYQCNICCRTLSSIQLLQKHMQSHRTVGEQFFCDLCKTSIFFKTKALLEMHMKNRHCKLSRKLSRLKCSICEKEFSTQGKCAAHERRHDKSTWSLCTICNTRFYCLNRHINAVHRNLRNFVCHICGAAYKQGFTLKEHVETIHSQNGYFCDICKNGRNYRSKGYIKRHFTKIHAKKDHKQFYECSLCNEHLPSKYTLQRHIATTHSKNRLQYSCRICDKLFALKSSLRVHEKVHSGKQHKCHVCGMFFNHPKYLATHLKRHKNVKEWK